MNFIIFSSACHLGEGSILFYKFFVDSLWPFFCWDSHLKLIWGQNKNLLIFHLSVNFIHEKDTLKCIFRHLFSYLRLVDLSPSLLGFKDALQHFVLTLQFYLSQFGFLPSGVPIVSHCPDPKPSSGAFSAGPVVKSLCFHRKDHRFDPYSGK